MRIYEKRLTAHVYSGDLATGQSVLHLNDLISAVRRVIERRKSLPPELPILLGEPTVMAYGQIQRELGRLIHDEDWETRSIPKSMARLGAVVEDDVLEEDAFIRPWMVDSSDAHYELDLARAHQLLDWKPRRTLRTTLPKIVAALKADPYGWYKANKLNAARVADHKIEGAAAAAETEAGDPVEQHEMMRQHVQGMRRMHFDMLWVHWLGHAQHGGGEFALREDAKNQGRGREP